MLREPQHRRRHGDTEVWEKGISKEGSSLDIEPVNNDYDKSLRLDKNKYLRPEVRLALPRPPSEFRDD